MVTIQITPVDISRLKVILSAMKRGKWELEGEEVLAFAQGFSWAAEMHDRIKLALEPVKPSLPTEDVTYTTKPKAKAKK